MMLVVFVSGPIPHFRRYNLVECLFIYLFIYLFICLFIYLFIRLFIHLFTCSFIYSFIPMLVHLLIYLFIFVCLFVCLFIYLFYLFSFQHLQLWSIIVKNINRTNNLLLCKINGDITRYSYFKVTLVNVHFIAVC